MRFYLPLILISLLGIQSLAQVQGIVYTERPQAQVVSGSNQLRAAWAGGYNSPQVAMADLNNDNRMDMVVYERFKEVKTFINVAASGPAQYQYNPAYAKHFPHIEQYIYLLDYNCDGIEDLIHYGGNGTTLPGVGYGVFKGYYVQDTLRFQFYKNLFYQMFGGWINAYSSPYDVPGIADVDGDGDIDFVAYANSGTRIDFYKNLRVEHGLPCDSIRIQFNTNCWGKVSQGPHRAHLLGIGGPSSFCFDSTARPSDDDKVTMHANNTICLLDIDADGDMDYLNGNLSFSDIQLLINGKSNYNWFRDTMMAQDTLWQAGGTQLNLPFFPLAHHLDADGDGKRDILITPHGEGASKNYDQFYLYKNVGSPTSPQFQYQQNDFLQNISLDMGSNSYPVFYDYNKDGKPDLFIGSTGLFQTGGQYRGQLMHLQNNSSAGNPAFSFQTKDMLSLSTYNLKGVAPAFGDLDNDGKDDLIIGHTDGTLSFFRNTASSNTVQPQWTGAPIPLTAINGPIDVGDAAVPAIYDMNKDGKLDLVIGNQTGFFNYYQNNGGTGLQLQLVNPQLGGVKVEPSSPFVGYSTPFVGKMDNTEIPYLLSGSSNGAMYRFDGFQAGNVGGSFGIVDTMYSSLIVGTRTAPAIADIDGNGSYDMVIGNALGGVKLYTQTRQVSPPPPTGTNTVDKKDGFELFPNPAAQVVHLRRAIAASAATVRVFTPTGQVLKMTTFEAGVQAVSLDVSGFASGVYFCEIDSEGQRAIRQFSVVR